MQVDSKLQHAGRKVITITQDTQGHHYHARPSANHAGHHHQPSTINQSHKHVPSSTYHAMWDIEVGEELYPGGGGEDSNGPVSFIFPGSPVYLIITIVDHFSERFRDRHVRIRV